MKLPDNWRWYDPGDAWWRRVNCVFIACFMLYELAGNPPAADRRPLFILGLTALVVCPVAEALERWADRRRDARRQRR